MNFFNSKNLANILSVLLVGAQSVSSGDEHVLR